MKKNLKFPTVTDILYNKKGERMQVTEIKTVKQAGHHPDQPVYRNIISLVSVDADEEGFYNYNTASIDAEYWPDEYSYSPSVEPVPEVALVTEERLVVADEIIDENGKRATVIECGVGGPGYDENEEWFRYRYNHNTLMRFQDPMKGWMNRFAVVKRAAKESDGIQVSPEPGIDPVNRHSPLDEVIPAQRELNQMLYDESDRKANCIREYFASLGVPDGIVPGDELDGLFRDKKIYFLGVIPNTKNQFVFYNEDGGFECCGKISRPEKQLAEKSAREEAVEILEKHWYKCRTTPAFDDLIKQNMSYAIDAIEEALTKNQK